MDALVTEVYHLKGDQKHPLNGKDVNRKDLGDVYLNVVGSQPGRYQMLVFENSHEVFRRVVDYIYQGREQPVSITIPTSPGYHNLQVEYARFRCYMDYTIR